MTTRTSTGRLPGRLAADDVSVALPRREERSGSHLIKRLGGLGGGEDENQIVHRLRSPPRTTCDLGGDGAGGLAEIGEKLFGGLVRGGQKETRRGFEPPYPFENPPLRAFPDALEYAKASLLGRLLELGHRGDARSAQGLDAAESRARVSDSGRLRPRGTAAEASRGPGTSPSGRARISRRPGVARYREARSAAPRRRGARDRRSVARGPGRPDRRRAP